MALYADVALPVAVDKTFTYLLPPGLERSAIIGARAVVPFGRKYVTGLIVALPPSTSVPGLKPIKDILDASPVVSEELLSLCKWIAEYYFAPLGEVLKAALPHGFTTKTRRLVRIGSRVTDDDIETMRKHARQRAVLLKLIQQHGPVLSSKLQQETGLKNINAVLNDLASAGYLEVVDIAPPPGKSVRTELIVQLAGIDPKKLSETLDSLSPRRKKARQLLESVRQLKDQGSQEIPLAALLKTSGASSAAFKGFRDSGLIPTIGRAVVRRQDYGTEEQTLTIILNDTQRDVLGKIVAALDQGHHRTFLLHGVTGSGKTQVYIEAIRECLRRQKTAIVLVPEISLTPQIVRRFKSHFGIAVGVVHSRMAAGERIHVWQQVLRGEHTIVIGPRSAIFAPLQHLGLIVIDEEHEASYKQYDASPRYSARDVGIVRATSNNAVVVLGSATPSVESYSNALSGKYDLQHMPNRIDEVPLPDIALVDMTKESHRAYAAAKEATPLEQRRGLREFQQPTLSLLLQAKIKERIERHEGIILLQNRRGFAPFVECVECGFTETCDNCSITLTYHIVKRHLRCHYCGLVRAARTLCPQCRGVGLQLRGVGTQRVEEELSQLLPEARVLRMDLDTTSRLGSHDRILRKFAAEGADILLGTQMVAKGLDFPRVTLVGVISADTQMLLPDFRASERTFQLLTQVAGRAGRSTLHGEVIIQTHRPEHHVLSHVVDHDFKAFYEEELASRRELAYPPFSRLVLVETKGEKEADVQGESERFAGLLRRVNGTYVILGPSPAVIARINNMFRWHIIIKIMKTHDPSGAHLRSTLRNVIAQFTSKQLRRVRLTIDVDPVGLM